MAELPRRVFRYWIDPSDRIRDVDDAWIAFARENGAPELSRAAVRGRPLLDFVDGRETRALYGALFDRARRGRPVGPLPFRCDSPERYRFMELRLRPTPDGGIELSSELIRERPRQPLALLEKALPRTTFSWSMCSLCKRVFVFGEWMEADEAVRRLDMLTPPVPRLEAAVCDDCRRAAVEEEARPPASRRPS